MPLYDFRCKNCGKEFWDLIKDIDNFKPVCEKCQSEQVDRVLSVPNFKLKGKGWYKDGYERGGK